MADMGRLRYPMFPIDWLLNQRFDTAQKVARLLQPIVIVHGTRDDIVPAGMAERLLAAAREPKRLLLVPGAGHEDALQNSGQLLQEAITQFVQQCDRSRQPKSIRYPGSPGTRAPRLVTAPEQPAWVRQPVDQQCPKYCWSPKCTGFRARNLWCRKRPARPKHRPQRTRQTRRCHPAHCRGMTCRSKSGPTDISPVNGRLWEAISTTQAARLME